MTTKPTSNGVAVGSTEWVCPPLRRRVQTLMETGKTGSRTVKGYHCIEAKQGKKWTLLGDDNGLYKFDSSEAADSKIREIQGHTAAISDSPTETKNEGEK